MGMIATVQTQRQPLPCIVFWTGKASMISVISKTWCGETVSAGDGVTQLPDNAKCCIACTEAIANARHAYDAMNAAIAEPVPSMETPT